LTQATILTTRERLLTVATRLFLEKGYNATSVAGILRESDTNSGSLYHFFATKQDLLIGVLDQYRDGIETLLFEPVWSGVADPVERIFALLEGYRRMLVESEYRLGCPIGNIALEIAAPDASVRERLVENFDAWTDGVERCLDQAGKRIPDGVDRRALARCALITMEGGVMLSRAYRDIGPFDQAVAGYRDYLKRLGVRF
jgi:AcrR family transcriptional regulator